MTAFLTKLDDVGILAGESALSREAPNSFNGPQIYFRVKFFNPERLFERLLGRIRWIWTPGFLLASLGMMAVALMLSLIHWAEMSSYVVETVKQHYRAIFIAGTFVGLAHEFAHGLTCKAFGGSATEVGALMIYYVFPALYCNVSGIHLIQRRSQRLWVIGAGVYMQLLAGRRRCWSGFLLTRARWYRTSLSYFFWAV